MANEEQRKAFASYMGKGDTAQQATQYPSAAANTANPYLYQMRSVDVQFAGLQGLQGLQGLPAAPTPPPAAPSSIASYPSHQAVSGYPQAGFPHGLYQQNALPQRPPPLREHEAFQAQSPPSATAKPYYSPAGQYPHATAQYSAGLRSAADPTTTMIPSPRHAPPEVVQYRSKHLSEHRQYEQYGRPPHDITNAQAAESPSVPVLLCHTCNVCGRMRSNGYHRNHPVIPGKPLVLSTCRKCKKKGHYRSHSYTRIRTCSADSPCDWPNDSVRVDMEYVDRRGRQRQREEAFMNRHSRSRPRIIRQESGEANIGLRVLQHDRCPQRGFRNEATLRVSSLSPGRSTRYGGVWPPPDIVLPHDGPSRQTPQHHTTSQDEVWPPPDVVCTHSYRKSSRSPPYQQRSRIIELSPSPSPVRRESTRVVYRSTSRERRTRSVSPPRLSVRDARRSEDAEARLMSHPRPFRSVAPEHRNLGRSSDETSSHAESLHEPYSSASGRSILKSSRGDHETARRRMSMRDSQQSTTVEVGGPKVHFGSARGSHSPADTRSRSQYAESRPVQDDHYHDYSRTPIIEERPAPPPLDEMKRLHLHRRSPSPLRSNDSELRADRARRLSPSPPPSNPYGSAQSRRMSHLPSKISGNLYPPSPIPERRSPSGYRYVRRSRSLTPPLRSSRNAAAEDVTDSDSAHSGNVTEVRSWRGLDENGKPATFVEERRSVRRIEQGNERDGGDFRSLGERAASRTWRDV